MITRCYTISRIELLSVCTCVLCNSGGSSSSSGSGVSGGGGGRDTCYNNMFNRLGCINNDYKLILK